MAPITQQQPLLDALRRYLEREGPVVLHETHISWVLVGSERVWKLKKPLDLGFLDYSTLDKRRHACEQELALNRRTLPELYRRVVSISGTPDAPEPDGEGEVIEVALEMDRFDEADLLLERLRSDRLESATIDALADTIASLHNRLPPASADSHFGSPQAVAQPMHENFSQISERLSAQSDGRLRELSRWTEAELERQHALLAKRKQDGFIRACHGDLHLANIVLWEGEPRPFDCIEFNPDLSTIDVISEIAFTRMDLQVQGRPDLAARLLSRYLERTGDYAGLMLLPLYSVYRALVRAKVAAIRAAQGDAQALAEYRNYRDLALSMTRPRRPRLWFTYGLSGSGKSTLAQAAVEQFGAVRLRADVERKRLFGLSAEARSESVIGGGIYTSEASARTYARLAELAEYVLAAGLDAVIDATCLKRAQRALFSALADRLGIAWGILALEVPEAELRRRVERRLAKGRDASEANLDVLAAQLRSCEPPSGDELVHTHHFSAAKGEKVMAQLQALADG